MWEVRDREHWRSLAPRANAVFEGLVLGPAPVPPSEGGPALTAVRVAVARRWRGNGGDTVTVATPRSPDTACGARLEPGKRYLIVADTARAGWLFTTKCVPTRQWDAMADTLAGWLGAPQPSARGVRPPEA